MLLNLTKCIGNAVHMTLKSPAIKLPLANCGLRFFGVFAVADDELITSESRRITDHPVLGDFPYDPVKFSWDGAEIEGSRGEMLSSALIANGIDVYGHHPKDGSPQGLFCANGQCSQCMVVVNGLPVKSCMTPVLDGMEVVPMEGVPSLPPDDALLALSEPPDPIDTDVLIVGAGPAGLSAAVQLGERGVRTLVLDDKDRVGGKLVLQTHKFFGTKADCYAGTRGYEIADILAEQVARCESVDVALGTTAVAVYSDGLVGTVAGDRSALIRPKRIMVATGAREKFLTFPGNSLPGVYGAGAFQTLVNRDLVRPCSRVLIVGGGNVGLIAGYHALQAGIEVAGLVEAARECGGYQVHMDKLHRMGVPIMTQHTVVEATPGEDGERLGSVVVAKVNDRYEPIPETRMRFDVDGLLIAVGLEPCDEFHRKAQQYSIPTFIAGDAREIAEASSAMFTGKITGLEIAASLGVDVGEIPEEWKDKEQILKHKPGPVDHVRGAEPSERVGVVPVIHCFQEVPCNACTTACDLENITISEGGGVVGIPHFEGDAHSCTGCARCVTRCPGLAVTVVDYTHDSAHPSVTLPYELWRHPVERGDTIAVVDEHGVPIGRYPVEAVCEDAEVGTAAVTVRLDRDDAHRAAGVWFSFAHAPISDHAFEAQEIPDDAIVCRCERVTAGEIRAMIRSGIRDENELKAATRCGFGACGSKTCHHSLDRLFAVEGVSSSEVEERTLRPMYVEVPLGAFAEME